MSIYVLKDYVEDCIKNCVKPTFEGLNIYYKAKKIKFKKSLLLTSKEKSIIIKDTVRLSVVNVNWIQKN